MSIISRFANLFAKPTRCQDVDRFLCDYLEQNLDADTQRLFEEHLGKCPACTTFLKQHQATISVTKQAGSEVELPRELVEQTLEFLRARIQFDS